VRNLAGVVTQMHEQRGDRVRYRRSLRPQNLVAVDVEALDLEFPLEFGGVAGI
jgi:hypothetical protein